MAGSCTQVVALQGVLSQRMTQSKTLEARPRLNGSLRRGCENY